MVREIVRRVMGGSGGVARFPIGAVYLSVTGVDPATELGYGTWAAFGAGQALVGFSGVAPFDVSEASIGNATHSHTYTDVPNHTHPITPPSSSHSHKVDVFQGGISPTAGAAALQGVDEPPDLAFSDQAASPATATATNNPTGGVATGTTATASTLPPSIVVYMWKRTA